MRKTNYLNNKDILKEIHKSKSTFCSYTDDDYADFDIILSDIGKTTTIDQIPQFDLQYGY